MKLKAYFILLLAFATAAFTSDYFELEYPNYFPTPEYDFSNNTLTKEKIELGRALFYDPVLSKDNSVSCATCHSPYNAFAHTDHDLSHGINDEIGTRNAPALFNLAWQKTFMWDGAINHLDMQALAPITHAKEMNETLKNVISKLQSKEIYPTLFYQAFQDSIITGEHILKALSQFQLTLVSANSKYDQMKRGEVQFSQQERNGYQLFQKNCNSCHTEPLFSNGCFANNALPIDTTLNDFGKWMVTEQSIDSLQFKIPTLRNLSYTYPYMHDGRFRKLKEVLNHYSKGIFKSSNTISNIKNNIRLTSNEKVDLIAFLKTLNDKEFVFNQKHQFPREILQPKK